MLIRECFFFSDDGVQCILKLQSQPSVTLGRAESHQLNMQFNFLLNAVVPSVYAAAESILCPDGYVNAPYARLSIFTGNH